MLTQEVVARPRKLRCTVRDLAGDAAGRGRSWTGARRAQPCSKSSSARRGDPCLPPGRWPFRLCWFSHSSGSPLAICASRESSPLSASGWQDGRCPATGPAGRAIRTSIDSPLLRNPVAFYLLVAALSAACWLAGWTIAANVPRFLASHEWHIQPFYVAAHLVALRLFVGLFVRKYVAGAAQLDISADEIAAGIHRILGRGSVLLAAAIAVPFCALDYRYLVSDDYEKLSEDQALHIIDYLMWGIWCAEWLLNAMIWVTLAGFLAMSYRELRSRRFRAPIATVVQDKLYRPFLQMSSQGASIVLVFACVTAFYIWYAGGAASDFLGLGVTGVLLVAGFIPSWLVLNGKVKRTVREEIEALRRIAHTPPSGAAYWPAPQRVGRAPWRKGSTKYWR